MKIKPCWKKTLLGLALGAAVFCVCALFYSLKAGAALGALYTVVGVLRFRCSKKRSWLRAAFCAVSALALILAAYCASEFMITCDWGWITDVAPGQVLLNLLGIALFCTAVYLVCLKPRPALAVGTTLFMLLMLADYYVVKFRGNELTPMDFAYLRTAANVAGSYDYSLSANCFYSLAFYGAALFSLWCFDWDGPAPRRPAGKRRLAAAAALCAGAVVFMLGCPKRAIGAFGNEGTARHGYLVTFHTQLRELLKDKKPETYTPERLRAYEEEYSQPEQPEQALPDIFIIMDEAFADLRVLGGDLRTQEPVMPVFDSLRENTIRGYALASVFGGGTANSEYEVLTGNTTAFVNAGATVYQLYLRDPGFSLAQLLRGEGYTAQATHPFLSSGWSRTRAWPNLGFEDISFVESYPQEKLVRDFVGDEEMFETVLRNYARQPEDAPLFLFGVTMQNHSNFDYTGSGYTPSVKLEGYSQPYPDVEQYLGLIRESDRALGLFLDALKDSERRAVVLFFGDHLPRISDEFYAEQHGGSFASLDEVQQRFTVPFCIWANYDIEEQEIPCTSLNFLGRYLLEAAGIQLPPYYQFLKEVESVIPAMNAQGYYSVSQERYLPYEEASGQELEILTKYRELQYNALFEKPENRSAVFFPVYTQAEGTP